MLGTIGRWLVRLAAPTHVSDPAKRALMRAAPFPEEWRSIIERDLPYVARLTPAQRDKLFGDINVFVGEKTIVGTNDFIVDDRVKLIVAASAAMLVLGRDISLFDHVRRIEIRHEISRDIGGQYHVTERTLGGEVVETYGVVELGWNRVLAGLARPDGQNTALHEFAHAFDHADGKMDALVTHVHYDRWRARLRQLTLLKRTSGGFELRELIGDVDGPELFASATELFFECPRRLHSIDGDLFEALVGIYALDPRTIVDHY